MQDAVAFEYELPAEPLARGAQGAVYLATRSDGRQVAVKVAGEGSNAVETLQREAQILKALGQARIAGVVKCLDTPTINGRPAIVMPVYVGHLGQWLTAITRQPSPASLDEILGRTAEIARTLSRLHQFNHGGQLVHRDVKPENVFVDAKGRLYLGDFGCAMTIDGLQAVELALFGTPMWAPIDQFLPGKTIPDPTWDTYALCVMLYAALTGSRPAYQADPRELLTSKGRQLWELGRRAVSADGPHSRELRTAFAHERMGATAADLIDCTGRAALIDTDRAVIQTKFDALADLAGLSPGNRAALQRGLWSILVRGLSPTSHPSPPNRFRAAEELAEQLQDLRDLARRQGTPTPPPMPRPAVGAMPGPAEGPDLPIDLSAEDDHRPLPSFSRPVAPIVVGLVSVGFVALILTVQTTWTALAVWREPAVVIDNGKVPAFRLDRFEVDGARWGACVEAGVCAAHAADESLPVSGISLAEAESYCGFAQGRLPTFEEWSAAAGSALFPWGDDGASCDHANALGCGEQLIASGTARDGASPQGVFDLAGNVWEWTSDGFAVGGGAESPLSELGSAGRTGSKKETPKFAGVRCAYDIVK